MLTLCLCGTTGMFAQSDPAPKEGVADKAMLQKASALFNQGKLVEALPLLEELAQESPKDSDLLVALAASLIEHAARLTDPEASVQERRRARDLLQQASNLGDTRSLGANLRQLLGDLPPNRFSKNPAVEQIIYAGEAAYARIKFDEALNDYAKALELEPSNYSAQLFTAIAYDRRKDFAKAAEWYERAMHRDPNVETAYRHYADMLARQGDMAKARALLIQAAVAEPYNKVVWRDIGAWATVNKIWFTSVLVAIPRIDDAAGGEKSAPELAPAWRTYYSIKQDWQKGGKFLKLFPQEGKYRRSLAEESEALMATAKALQQLKDDGQTADLVYKDRSADLLLKLHGAGLIEPYVLFSLGDDDIAKDYGFYKSKNRDKLETYMDKFAVPPAPAKPQ
jgi:tetratricopeptide (TPR) repeat protein